MSTRCQIGFYERNEKDLNKWEALIYRHCDGYPKEIIPDIEPFLRWFKTERGNISEIEYVSCRLLQYLCNKSDQAEKELLQEIGHEPKTGLTGTTGFCICKEFHGDIAYYYAIYPKEIVVYEVSDDDCNKWNKLQTISLEETPCHN